VVAALGVHVTEPETIEHALGLARQAAVQIAKSLVS
jgi:hypothetical protein